MYKPGVVFLKHLSLGYLIAMKYSLKKKIKIDD